MGNKTTGDGKQTGKAATKVETSAGKVAEANAKAAAGVEVDPDALAALENEIAAEESQPARTEHVGGQPVVTPDGTVIGAPGPAAGFSPTGQPRQAAATNAPPSAPAPGGKPPFDPSTITTPEQVEELDAKQVEQMLALDKPHYDVAVFHALQDRQTELKAEAENSFKPAVQTESSTDTEFIIPDRRPKETVVKSETVEKTDYTQANSRFQSFNNRFVTAHKNLEAWKEANPGWEQNAAAKAYVAYETDRIAVLEENADAYRGHAKGLRSEHRKQESDKKKDDTPAIDESKLPKRVEEVTVDAAAKINDPADIKGRADGTLSQVANLTDQIEAYKNDNPGHTVSGSQEEAHLARMNENLATLKANEGVLRARFNTITTPQTGEHTPPPTDETPTEGEDLDLEMDDNDFERGEGDKPESESSEEPSTEKSPEGSDPNPPSVKDFTASALSSSDGIAEINKALEESGSDLEISEQMVADKFKDLSSADTKAVRDIIFNQYVDILKSQNVEFDEKAVRKEFKDNWKAEHVAPKPKSTPVEPTHYSDVRPEDRAALLKEFMATSLTGSNINEINRELDALGGVDGRKVTILPISVDTNFKAFSPAEITQIQGILGNRYIDFLRTKDITAKGDDGKIDEKDREGIETDIAEDWKTRYPDGTPYSEIAEDQHAKEFLEEFMRGALAKDKLGEVNTELGKKGHSFKVTETAVSNKFDGWKPDRIATVRDVLLDQYVTYLKDQGYEVTSSDIKDHITDDVIASFEEKHLNPEKQMSEYKHAQTGKPTNKFSDISQKDKVQLARDFLTETFADLDSLNEGLRDEQGANFKVTKGHLRTKLKSMKAGDVGILREHIIQEFNNFLTEKNLSDTANVTDDIEKTIVRTFQGRYQRAGQGVFAEGKELLAQGKYKEGFASLYDGLREKIPLDVLPETWTQLAVYPFYLGKQLILNTGWIGKGIATVMAVPYFWGTHVKTVDDVEDEIGAEFNRELDGGKYFKHFAGNIGIDFAKFGTLPGAIYNHEDFGDRIGQGLYGVGRVAGFLNDTKETFTGEKEEKERKPQDGHNPNANSVFGSEATPTPPAPTPQNNGVPANRVPNNGNGGFNQSNPFNGNNPSQQKPQQNNNADGIFGSGASVSPDQTSPNTENDRAVAEMQNPINLQPTTENSRNI